MERVRRWLRREHGACHGLVNNAGITMRTRLGEVSLADWNRTLAINVTGPMLGMQALMDLMPAGSSIVNIASIAALTRSLRDSLHREQVGAQRSLARGQPRARPARYSRERRDAWADGHVDDLGCAAASVRGAHRQRAACAGRHHRRRGRDRPVPAQRGVVLSERSRDTGRWWPDGARRHEVALGCRPGRGIRRGKPPIRVSTAGRASSPSAASNVTPYRSIRCCASAAIACHSCDAAARSNAARSSQYTSATRNIARTPAHSPRRSVR